MEKTLSVSAIKNGTVIDHITAGNALRIIRILDLPAKKRQVTVGLNLPSKAMGKKDLIKVEGKELSEQEVNEVALLAPQTSINIIKNYKVTKKIYVTLPEIIGHIIVCPNPTCITNHERMETKFKTHPTKKGLKLCCYYCEKFFAETEIKNYNV
jgi:aspartate carbamoyltransferase regulatory subunit